MVTNGFQLIGVFHFVLFGFFFYLYWRRLMVLLHIYPEVFPLQMQNWVLCLGRLCCSSSVSYKWLSSCDWLKWCPGLHFLWHLLCSAGPFKYKSPWLKCWEGKVDPMKLVGTGGGFPVLAVFPVFPVAARQSLLTGEFGCGSAELLIPAEPFLSTSWWKQSQTCRTCSQQKVFCCLPCPFTAFVVLRS